jgi:hypothetical protein
VTSCRELILALAPARLELADQILRVDSELLQEILVLFVVDLVRQLLLSLLLLVMVALLAEHLDDLLLIDPHFLPP